ncbi:MAG: ABC transporter permease [Bacillota bacterium]
MRMLRLLRLSLALSVQRQLAHRVNLAFELFQTAIAIGAGVGAVLLLFTQVGQVAGWSRTEVIVLLGAYYVMSGLLRTFVEPNLDWFNEQVVSGQLDDKLLQPVPLLFAVSLSTSSPLALTQVALGAVVLVSGAAVAPPSAGQVAAYLILTAAGAVVAWGSRTLLAALAFWAPGLEFTILYSAFWQLGRYPVAVYHPGVRALLTYVVPVAFVSTFPALALTRGASPALLAGALLAAGSMLTAVLLIWRQGLARYTSATS